MTEIDLQFLPFRCAHYGWITCGHASLVILLALVALRAPFVPLFEQLRPRLLAPFRGEAQLQIRLVELDLSAEIAYLGLLGCAHHRVQVLLQGLTVRVRAELIVRARINIYVNLSHAWFLRPCRRT